MPQDPWMLNAVKNLFEQWGHYPSMNPTDIDELAQDSEYSKEYLLEQKKNCESLLLNITEMEETSDSLSFYKEQSQEQFQSIEWEQYCFDNLRG